MIVVDIQAVTNLSLLDEMSDAETCKFCLNDDLFEIEEDSDVIDWIECVECEQIEANRFKCCFLAKLKEQEIDEEKIILELKKLESFELQNIKISLNVEETIKSFRDSETVFTHYKKGNSYKIVDYCLIRNEKGDWVDGVIYERVGKTGDLIFVRTVENFFESFSILED